MAQPDKSSGRHRDIPQSPAINVNAGASAGASSDFEHVIYYTPNLTAGLTPGEAGDMPINTMNVRYAFLIFEATETGQATNNFTLNFIQRRGGNILVNTSSSTTITGAGIFTVTPASMANIQANSRLVFSGGTGATETVVVTSVTPTTFTATFANNHSGAYTITSAPLATVTYAAGINETAFVAHQFTIPMSPANAIIPGDIITIQRVTSGTGQITPPFTAGLDLVPAAIYT